MAAVEGYNNVRYDYNIEAKIGNALRLEEPLLVECSRIADSILPVPAYAAASGEYQSYQPQAGLRERVRPVPVGLSPPRPRAYAAAPVVVNYSPFNVDFSRRTQVNVKISAGKSAQEIGREKEKEEHNQRIAAVAIGAAVLAAGGYLLGKCTAEIQKLSRSYKPFESAKNKWADANNDIYRDKELLRRNDIPDHVNSAVKEIVEKTTEIVDRNKKDHWANIAFAISLVAAGILGVVGGLAASYPLMLAGVGVAIISIAAKLFKWGFDRNDTSRLENAEFVSEKIKLMGSQSLPGYEEACGTDNPPAYCPNDVDEDDEIY